MPNVCQRAQYSYPQDRLIRPDIVTLYDWTRSFKDKMPHTILVLGNVKCRGYQGHFSGSLYFVRKAG